jgi:hypothetical protein
MRTEEVAGAEVKVAATLLANGHRPRKSSSAAASNPRSRIVGVVGNAMSDGIAGLAQREGPAPMSALTCHDVTAAGRIAILADVGRPTHR